MSGRHLTSSLEITDWTLRLLRHEGCFLLCIQKSADKSNDSLPTTPYNVNKVEVPLQRADAALRAKGEVRSYRLLWTTPHSLPPRPGTGTQCLWDGIISGSMYPRARSYKLMFSDPHPI